MWMSHGTCEWVMSYSWLIHMTDGDTDVTWNESWHIWMSHGTCEWVVSYSWHEWDTWLNPFHVCDGAHSYSSPTNSRLPCVIVRVFWLWILRNDSRAKSTMARAESDMSHLFHVCGVTHSHSSPTNSHLPCIIAWVFWLWILLALMTRSLECEMWHGCDMDMTWMWHECDMNVRHECDMNVTWMWHACDMNVTWMWHEYDMNVTWMWHECDMNVTWMWHECDMNVTWMWHEYDMNVTWMWHEYDMNVTWMWHAWQFPCMTVSTEIATPPKSTKSRNSDFSVYRGAHSNSDSAWTRICTEEFEFLDLVDFGGVAFSVEAVICDVTHSHSSSMTHAMTYAPCVRGVCSARKVDYGVRWMWCGSFSFMYVTWLIRIHPPRTRVPCVRGVCSARELDL